MPQEVQEADAQVAQDASGCIEEVDSMPRVEYLLAKAMDPPKRAEDLPGAPSQGVLQDRGHLVSHAEMRIHQKEGQVGGQELPSTEEALHLFGFDPAGGR